MVQYTSFCIPHMVIRGETPHPSNDHGTGTTRSDYHASGACHRRGSWSVCSLDQLGEQCEKLGKFPVSHGQVL